MTSHWGAKNNISYYQKKKKKKKKERKKDQAYSFLPFYYN